MSGQWPGERGSGLPGCLFTQAAPHFLAFQRPQPGAQLRPESVNSCFA